ncbi:MAG: hypothetical protein LBN99_04670 [Oscillospiraceae bacterium]|jgi:CRISPR-associated protein Csx10|nr:hypothetical protein [Oscillospiraceae bacterium]
MTNIELELLSDTHAGAGLGAFGGVDAEISLDKYGLPIIPAKRVKGRLSEAGEEILSVFPQYSDIFLRLFGEKGSEKSGELEIHTGTLSKPYPAEDLVKEIKSERYTPSRVTELFTSLRTSTAVSEDDGLIHQTDESALRVIRVADKGLKFRFDVECPDDGTEFLGKCCLALRDIGANRTRGLGEVRCRLVVSDETAEASIGKFAPQSVTEHLKCATYFLELTEPVAISDDYIPGSLILGSFSSAWVRKHPGVPPHTSPEFRRLFLDGGVSFLSAYPLSDKGKVLYPAERGIRSKKDGNEIKDASFGDIPDEYTKTLTGFGYKSGSNYHQLGGVSRAVAAHHARPSDKSIGHAVENAGAESGAFYKYDALAQGLKFVGGIVGSDSDLEIIHSLADGTVRLGKSRSAQYGNVKFDWTDYAFLENEKLTVKSDESFKIILRSPLILTDDDGTVSPDPKLLLDALNLGGCSLVKVFCSAAVAAGYNSKWLLPRTQEFALAGGSVIVAKNESGKDIALDSVENFVGLRRGEGFGHVFIEKLTDSRLTHKQPAKQDTVSIGSAKTRHLKELILKQQVLSRVQYAVEQSKATNVTNSQLGRLRGYLSVCDSFDSLAEKLNSVAWKQTKDRENIQKFIFDQKAEDGDILSLLKQKAESVVESDIWRLLDERARYYWFKTYLIMLIRRRKGEKEGQ